MQCGFEAPCTYDPHITCPGLLHVSRPHQKVITLLFKFENGPQSVVTSR